MYITGIFTLNEVLLEEPGVINQVIDFLERKKQNESAPMWKRAGKALINRKTPHQKAFLKCLKIVVCTEKQLDDGLEIVNSSLAGFIDSLLLYLDETLRINGESIESQSDHGINFQNVLDFKEHLNIYHSNITRKYSSNEMFRELIMDLQGIKPVKST